MKRSVHSILPACVEPRDEERDGWWEQIPGRKGARRVGKADDGRIKKSKSRNVVKKGWISRQFPVQRKGFGVAERIMIYLRKGSSRSLRGLKNNGYPQNNSPFRL